jgi:hypothetical protein
MVLLFLTFWLPDSPESLGRARVNNDTHCIINQLRGFHAEFVLATRMLFIRNVIHQASQSEDHKGETKMKTTSTTFLTFTAAALWSVTGLCAQTKATANIPFAFSAQNSVLPAGEYTMYKASAGKDVMVIRNAETRKAIAVLAPSNVANDRNKNAVTFHRIGDRYFLAEVSTAGVKGRVPESKLERELESSGTSPMAAVIVAALNVR